jgi:DNA-binding transcriptional LysR family regulator
MDKNIPLEAQIWVLVVAREGNFHRAAKRLNITQPALTRKIAELEDHLGAKLFIRTSRGLELTEAGKLYVPEAQASVRHAERAFELARCQARIETGPVRLGYSPAIHPDVLAMLEKWQLETTNPRGLVLETATTHDLVEGVLRGIVHVGFGILPITEGDLWVNPVAREPLCLCVPKNHRLAQRQSIEARELDREIVFWPAREAHSGFYDHIMEYIHGLGIEPRIHGTDCQTQAMELVSHDFGVALLPRSVGRLSRTGIVFRPISDLYLRVETALFVRKEQRHGPLHGQIEDMLSQIRVLTIKAQ